MNKRGFIKKIMTANISSLLIIAKFLGLFLFGVFGLSDEDYFGQYSLCLGLVNVFYVVSGMRGRVLVLQSFGAFSDFKKFTVLMLGIGSVATILVVYLNFEAALFQLIVLVSLGKLAQNFLQSNTSFIQKNASREKSFGILNQHGLIVFVGFFALLPFGLKYAVAYELVVLLITLFRQWLIIKNHETDTTVTLSYKTVALKGVDFTLTAGLNAALSSFFIYYVSITFDTESIYLIAKIIAVQSVIVRIVSGNNIFFMKEIDGRIQAIGKPLVLGALCVWGTVSFIFLLTRLSLETSVVILILGVGFSLVNCASSVLRMHVLLQHGPSRIRYLHTLELIVILVACLAFELTPELALFIFGTVRVLRTFALGQRWFLKPQESGT